MLAQTTLDRHVVTVRGFEGATIAMVRRASAAAAAAVRVAVHSRVAPPSAQVRHAVDPLLEAQQRILLVVHNIDGRALRHPAFQVRWLVWTMRRAALTIARARSRT